MLTQQSVKVNYCVIETREDLMLCFDDLVDGVAKMIGKTGSRGQSTETIVKLILGTVGKPNTFLLTGYDDDARFQGFVYAMLVDAHPPWVDIIGIYTRPGVGVSSKYEVFEFLKAWARSKGATKIMAGITRRPQTFFKMFHQPLGFEAIGLIVEYDLTREEKGDVSGT